MNVILLIISYLLFISIVIFTFKNLYENFYTKKTFFGALILILCIAGLLFSFKGMKISNDIVIPSIRTSYKANDIIKEDILAVLSIGIAFWVIRFNKKKQQDEREEYRKKNPVDSDRFFSALRKDKKRS